MTELMMDLVLGHFACGTEVNRVCFGVEVIPEKRQATLPGSPFPSPVLTLGVHGPGRGLSPDCNHLGLGHADMNRGLFFKNAGASGLADNLLAGRGALRGA